MPSLGALRLLRVFAKHEPYTDGHLGKVTAEMRQKGPPTINVVDWRGDLYAFEGSHRLAAAHHLGLIPVLVPHYPDRVDPADEAYWEGVRGTLPHYSWLIP